MVFLQKIANNLNYKHVKETFKFNKKQGVNIGESGGQVTENNKAATFYQLLQPYILIKAISDKTYLMKLVDRPFMNITRPRS